MKINQLQENLTPASTPSVKTIPPKFGRSDEMLESDCGTTGAGSVASVSQPVGKMQRRGKGSMFQGIKTSEKFANSRKAGIKESYYNHDDNRTGFSKPVRQDDERNPEFDDKMRKLTGMIFYNVHDIEQAQQLGLKQTRTGKWYLRTGNRLAQQVADKAFGPGKVWYPKNESVEEDVESSPVSDLKTWQVVIFNNYYAGKYSDYRGRYYYVLARNPDEAKQVVLDNADGILQDILSMKAHNGKRILPPSKAVPITSGRIGKIEDGTVAGRMSTAGYKKMFGPKGLMMVKLSGGAVQDIQDPVVQGSDLKTVAKADLGQNELNLPSGYGDVVQPQKVSEKSKSQAQFRTMAAVAHNPKFAKKVGISQKVGKEFHSADRKQNYKDLPKEVDEASFDYTMKDLGNDYAGFPSQHSLKHKMLAKIKPEKQQLYKDKMNNTHDWDSLFALFKVAKERGDIIEPGTSQPTMGLNASLEQHADDKMKELGHKFKGVSEAGNPAQQAAIAIAKKKEQNVDEEKQRLDPKCWKGYKKQGTKMKGGVRVNNCVPVSEADVSEDKLAGDLYKDFQIFKKGVDKGIGPKAKDKEISNKAKDRDIIAKEGFDGEYDDEAGSAESNLLTTARAVRGLINTIGERDNLPEWVQEKIAKAEQMLVTSWDYLQSQKEQGIDPELDEDWQKVNKHDKTDGMSSKAVKAYRRENPGSKLKTAVTKKPSELKAGSKDAKRRKSFCARMSGVKGPMKDEHGKPTAKAKALKRWNC